MKITLRAIFLLSFCGPVFAETHLCQLPAGVTWQMSDKTHGLTYIDRTIKVGGDGQKFPKDVDALAIQRGLIACAPAIAKCYQGEAKPTPIKALISFELTGMNSNSAKASGFKFKWETPKSKKLEECLEKTWTETEFGLILNKPISVTVPFQVR